MSRRDADPPRDLSIAYALELIRRAVRDHQSKGGGAGDTWDLAIFSAGYRAGLLRSVAEEKQRAELDVASRAKRKQIGGAA